MFFNKSSILAPFFPPRELIFLQPFYLREPLFFGMEKKLSETTLRGTFASTRCTTKLDGAPAQMVLSL